MLKKRQWSLVTLATFVCLVGCKSKLENPELVDPIYKDLSQQVETIQREIEAEAKAMDKAKKEMEAAAPRSREKVVARRDFMKFKERVERLTQNLRYYEIRRDRRKAEDQKSYAIAFEKGEPWPNMEEYEQYLAVKRLREAPQIWDARVPKLHDRIKKAHPVSEEASSE